MALLHAYVSAWQTTLPVSLYGASRSVKCAPIEKSVNLSMRSTCYTSAHHIATYNIELESFN